MEVFKWLRKRSNTNANHQEVLSRMARLEEQLQLLLDEKGDSGDQERPTVVIQNVEQVIVEKLEHSNHFGTLEIQDLAGRLNIGLNFTGPIPEDVLNSVTAKYKNMKQAEQFQKHQPTSPNCTIRSKPNL